MQKYINEKNIKFHRNIIFLKKPNKPGLMFLTKKPPTLLDTIYIYNFYIYIGKIHKWF